VSTIYELDNRAAYTLTVGIAPTLNALLNWTARSVRVDNFTNQSVYLDDADSFIPGRSFGVILPIVANRAMAEAFTEEPPHDNVHLPVDDTFTDDEHPIVA